MKWTYITILLSSFLLSLTLTTPGWAADKPTKKGHTMNTVERNYSVFSKTRAGSVSVVRDLTEEEAKRIAVSLVPPVWKQRALGGTNGGGGGGAYPIYDTDSEMVEIWGPGEQKYTVFVEGKHGQGGMLSLPEVRPCPRH